MSFSLNFRIVGCICAFVLCFSPEPVIAQNGFSHRIDSLIKKGELAKAEKMLLEVYHKEAKPDPEVLRELSDVYAIKDDWKTARVYAEELVTLYPDNAEYQYRMGGVLGILALKNKLKALPLIDDIERHFIKAAELDPTHRDVRWALIEYYLELPGIIGGSYKKAYERARELSEISVIEGKLAMGYIEDYRNNDEEAERYFKKAMALNETAGVDYPRVNVHYQLGKIASRYNIQLDHGIRHLEYFITNYRPGSRIDLKWVYYHMARIYRHRGDADLSEVYLRKALKRDPEFEEALEEKALLGR